MTKSLAFSESHINGKQDVALPSYVKDILVLKLNPECMKVCLKLRGERDRLLRKQ